MTFKDLAITLLELEKTPSRLAMTEQLSVLFTQTKPEEIDKVCYLCLGRLSPLYDRIDFNLADKMVVRAIALAYNLEGSKVWAEYKTIGDLGEVGEKQAHQATASNSRSGKIRDLTEDPGSSISEVYSQLLSIAQDGGQGSQDRKVEALSKLFQELDSLSVKYIIRIVLGRLRLGFSDKTMLDALSVMTHGSKQARKQLDEVYQIFPDVGKLAQLVKQHGVKDLNTKVQVTLGVPIIPALAQRLKTATEMIDKMGQVMVEPKYDGTRVQIHLRKDYGPITNNSPISKSSNQTAPSSQLPAILKSFTRNLDDNSHMFPELIQGLNQIQAQEVILDGEAVGIHPKTGELLPFQMTITRKRKHGIDEAARDVPLKFFIYDILYHNGASLIQEPLYQRRALLEQTIKSGNIFELAPTITTTDPKVLRDYHAKQLKEKLEGVIVKKYDGVYRPGRLGFNWVKFKEAEDSQAKLSDTLDVVVMGFYRGKGKRTKFGIGAFLVGIKGESNQILTVAKIGTGLTDDQWYELKKRLDSLVSLHQPKDYSVPKNLEPDIWVDPELIVEVAADEITNSPLHSAGLALRFPRLVKFRDDKDLSTVTTLKEMKTII